MTWLVSATAVLFTIACSKADEHRPTPGATESTTRGADHIVVFGRHKPTKPTDPVPVRFDRFKVTTAAFSPDTIEGGHVTIELDVSSLRTDSSERDEDLKSPAYIDVAKFSTALIEVSNVKKKAGATYAAEATVSLRGLAKTYPVEFELLERDRDRIRVRGRHTFSRLDFRVGSDPSSDPKQQVDTELTIEMLLTIART
jgi:polyisoprenoid-binding protein YceI